MLLQAALDGLVFSGLYAMLGIAFYLTFGVMRRIDMSFGTVLMASVYLAAMAASSNGVPAATLLLALPLAVALGLMVSLVAFRLVGGDPRFSMASTLGIWMALEEIVIQSPGRGQGQPVPGIFEDSMLEFGSLFVRVDHGLVLSVALIVCCALSLLLRKTRLGLAIRATVHDAEIAALMGASPSAVVLAATVLAASVGCIAGYLFAASQQYMDVHFGMWATVKGLVILVAGRMQSVWSVVGAALLLGIAERVATELVGANWRELVGLLILMVLLGLMPRSLAVPATRST